MLVARSDAELDPKVRLVHLGRAIELAPAPSRERDAARKERALMFLELAKSGTLAAALRHELRHAAEELEALGEAVAAADAFRRLGDDEGRARALIAAGDVEELEMVLHEDVAQQRSSRELRTGASRAEELVAIGDRRAALATLESLTRAHPADASLKERLDWLRASRLLAPLVRVTRSGTSDLLVLGDAIRVGRSEGELVVVHSALSRAHVRLFRDASGVPHVVDLGSRNGTFLRGVRLGAPLPITRETELQLGGEVPLRLTPITLGAVHDADAGPAQHWLRVEVAGNVYLAPLGSARLGHEDWELVTDPDAWVALRRTAAAFFGTIALGPKVELLAGDSIAAERNGPPVVRVER